DLPGNWVRYHHLFRDFLQAKLQQINPEQVRDIRAKLAAVYEQRHDWDKAQALYYQLGNYEAIVNLIEASRATFGDTGRFRTLINWIDSLPADFLEQHVQIKALKGFLAIELGDTSAMELLQEIEGPLRERDELATLARILMARSTGHRILRRYQDSFEDAQEALRLIDQVEPDKPSPVKAGALRQIGLHLYDKGQMDEAQQYYDQSLAIYEQLNDVSGGAMVYLNKGMAYRLQGAYQKAEQAYQAAIDRWATYKNVIRQANVLNSLGVLQHTRGDYQRAYRTLEQAIEYARQIGSVRIQAFAYASLGDVYKDLAAFVAAHRSYQEARQLAETIQSNALLFYLDLVEISCWRLEQKLVQAQAALDNLAEGLTPYEQGMYQRECGLLALAQDDPAAAFAHLNSAQACLGQGEYLTEQVQLAVYLAVTAVQLDKLDFARKQLGHANYLASQIDNQHVLVAAAYEVRSWFADWNEPQAQQLYQQTESLHETNTAQRKLLRQQGSAIALAPPEFKIETLGNIQIYNNEVEVTSAEWQKHKIVKALFFLLLSHKRALTKEEIGVELWPDASTKLLKTAFKNALYRLRVALGKDVIYYDEVLGRYSFNRVLDYVWDVEQMQHGLDNAAVATDASTKLSQYTDALAHYNGEYLPLMDGNWVESMRTDLQRRYQQATLDCGLLALQEGAYQLAANCGHDLIRLDPYDEEAYRLLMRTYAAQGKRAQMHRQYLACQQALMDDLKLAPSTQTQELYQQLR
ncbi:MAG: tetratricopeptide repeat protein, partial [Anaerolineales bacterium]|nr:tetratricopeptide repeat protein [Anaerolineales bacterium]